MKYTKLIPIAAVLLCTLSLFACGGDSKNPVADTNSAVTDQNGNTVDAPSIGPSPEDSAPEGSATAKPAPVPTRPDEEIPALDHTLNNPDRLADMVEFTTDQLWSVWGAPTAELYGERGYVWEIENDYDYVLARYNEDGFVTETVYVSVMKATVTELQGNTMLVSPAASESELSSSNAFTVDLSSATDSVKEKLAVGVTVYISYDGLIMESYPAQLSGVTAIGTGEPTGSFAKF